MQLLPKLSPRHVTT